VAFGQIKFHRFAGHVRFDEGFDLRLSTKAVTICEIDREDGSLPIHGYAICSCRDQFSRRKGRAVSFGRAMAQLKKRILDSASGSDEEMVSVDL